MQIAALFTLCEIVLFVFYNRNVLRKIYIGIITVLLIIVPSLLTIYIISWVTDTKYLDLINKSNLLRILTNVSAKLFQFITMIIVLKFLKKEKIHISKYKISIYAFMMIISILSIVKIRNSLLNGAINTLFSIYITIIIVIIDLCVYLIFYYYSESNQRKLDIEMQRLTIHQQQKEIENVIKDYYEKLKIRHDINKYLNIAIEMMREKEYDKLETYLKSFKDDKLENVKTYINTKCLMQL